MSSKGADYLRNVEDRIENEEKASEENIQKFKKNLSKLADGEISVQEVHNEINAIVNELLDEEHDFEEAGNVLGKLMMEEDQVGHRNASHLRQAVQNIDNLVEILDRPGSSGDISWQHAFNMDPQSLRNADLWTPIGQVNDNIDSFENEYARIRFIVNNFERLTEDVVRFRKELEQAHEEVIEESKIEGESSEQKLHEIDDALQQAKKKIENMEASLENSLNNLLSDEKGALEEEVNDFQVLVDFLLHANDTYRNRININDISGWLETSSNHFQQAVKQVRENFLSVQQDAEETLEAVDNFSL